MVPFEVVRRGGGRDSTAKTSDLVAGSVCDREYIRQGREVLHRRVEVTLQDAELGREGVRKG